MTAFRGIYNMKNILSNCVLVLVLLNIAACSGGGGDSQTPTTKTTYSLTFGAGENGTLYGTTSQSIAQSASSSSVIAVPIAGYHFVNWTEGGGVVGVDASLSVTNISASHDYYANFAVNPVVKSTAKLSINLTGTLPLNTAIAGACFTIILPANVTPAMNSGVLTGVVSPSGTFAGSTLYPQVVYSAATSSESGKLKVVLANSVPTGVTQIGEVATITLRLANGAVPTVGSFGLSTDSAFDTTLYDKISGIGANIVSVTLL